MLLDSLKAEGCFVCGERDPVVLQFHHVYPAEKNFNLSGGRVCKSTRALQAEAAKCLVLCANHHARADAGLITFERDGTGRFVLTSEERETHERHATPYHCRPVVDARFHGGR